MGASAPLPKMTAIGSSVTKKAARTSGHTSRDAILEAAKGATAAMAIDETSRVCTSVRSDAIRQTLMMIATATGM